MNELALFAGAGGGILGGHLLGWRTICAVERDAYAAQVLAQRQNDGALPAFPIWSDVCSFDGKPWRGLVDVVSGGFPCQDISAAGNGTGIDGARSGLWTEMARIIGEVRPAVVYVENSPLLVGRGLAVVLSDLAEMGYDAQWCIVSASDVGAPHQRDRCWIVAHDNRVRESQSAGQQQECRLGLEQCGEDVANTCGGRRGESSCRQVEQSRRAETFSGSEAVADTDCNAREQGRKDHSEKRSRGRNADRGCICQELAYARGEHGERIVAGGADTQVRRGPIERQAGSRGDGFGRWPAEPGMGRVADGVANRVDRIKALGNGQVPRVAAAAFNILSE
ncbi:DNA cytosine methyltransferase [Pseudomonas viridiflava]|uniref:DNA cytosine methyltransferase n=1 Tax=Pseudomonas viridiflava TaxID=33069 RepID=UPI001C3132EF|nr:DNA cytosine methyltransferase [Pseudomonas viridiflava]QXG34003.1 DNA cytosine methyltransferase [Pseudomonas viridiflava]